MAASQWECSVSSPPLEGGKPQSAEKNENEIEQQIPSMIYRQIDRDENHETKISESKPRRSENDELGLVGLPANKTQNSPTSDGFPDDCGRERLKRHRREMAGRVWIPEIWGQEELLKDWIDCSAFDESLFSNSIGSARAALIEEGRRANTGRLRLENRC